jgi:hypothetical protein
MGEMVIEKRVTMRHKEVEQLPVIAQVACKQIKPGIATAQLGLTVRQVKPPLPSALLLL